HAAADDRLPFTLAVILVGIAFLDPGQILDASVECCAHVLKFDLRQVVCLNHLDQTAEVLEALLHLSFDPLFTGLLSVTHSISSLRMPFSLSYASGSGTFLCMSRSTLSAR